MTSKNLDQTKNFNKVQKSYGNQEQKFDDKLCSECKIFDNCPYANDSTCMFPF